MDQAFIGNIILGASCVAGLITVIFAAGRVLQRLEDNTKKTESNGKGTEKIAIALSEMATQSAVRDERTHQRLSSMEKRWDLLEQDSRNGSGMFAQYFRDKK